MTQNHQSIKKYLSNTNCYFISKIIQIAISHCPYFFYNNHQYCFLIDLKCCFHCSLSLLSRYIENDLFNIDISLQIDFTNRHKLLFFNSLCFGICFGLQLLTLPRFIMILKNSAIFTSILGDNKNIKTNHYDLQ